MIIPRPTGRPSWRNIAADRLLKVCGMDAELGNFILGRKSSTSLGSGAEASRLLLKEIPGVKTESRGLTQDSGGTSSWSGWVSPPAPSTTHGSPWLYGSGGDSSYTEPASSPSGGYGAGYGYGAYGFPSYNPQDWGRKFLASNGGCFYIDLSHLEVCLPEVTSAFDHVACWHAMLLIARQALEDANALLPRGETIKVLVNNSDGKGSSYGSHLNFLLTRQGWENIFHRKLHHMLFLASHLTSSIVYSGSGKVGSEDGAPPVDYQLSQRADFFRSLCAPQTTYDRPIVNSRDESLADHETMARLHVIFFDSTLCHVASLLKVGVTQIIVAMIEQEFVDPRLILDDPLEALLLWSHDVDLRATARLTTGEQYRAVDVQWAFHELARRFVDEGGAEGVVPRAAEILSIWEETLRRLDSDVDSLASHVDWVLKRSILRQAMELKGVDWHHPDIVYLSHIYHSLDREEGLYWAYERLGALESVVTGAEIERFVHQPPEDTRAWTRAQLLRRAQPREIDLVDWDSLGVRSRGRGRWPHSRSLRMPDPLSFRRCDVEEIFRSEGPVGEIIERLAEAAPPGEPAAPEGQPARGEGWHAPARLSPGDPAPN